MIPDLLAGSGEAGAAVGALELLAASTLKATLLLVVAAAAALALRRASAARRHLLWTAAVAATLAMPFLSAAAPDLEVPVPGLELASASPDPELPAGAVWGSSFAGLSTRPTPLGEPAGSSAGAVDARAPLDLERLRERAYEAAGIGEADRNDGLRQRAESLETRTRAIRSRLAGLEERVAALERLGRAAGGESGAKRSGSEPTDPGPTARPGREALAGGVAGVPGAGAGPGDPPALGATSAALLLAVWLAGSLAVLSTLLLGFLRLRWIRRRAAVLTDGPLAAAAARVADRLGLDRRPTLLQGDDGDMPMTWGVRRPVVLLPAGAEDWERWRLEAVLLHELAHVARRDYPAQIAARLACALYWFHPLAWIAAHRLRVEREHACDDVVVRGGADPSAYAEGLLAIARSLRAARPASAAGLGMARPDHLRDRLLALLDRERDRRPLTQRQALAASFLGLAVALPLAALSPSPAGERDVPGSPPEGERDAPSVDAPAALPAAAPARPASGRESAPARGPRPAAVAEPPTASTVGPFDAPAARQEAATLCGPADGEHERTAHMTDDGLTVVETASGDCRAAVRIEGEIRFDDDFASIASLSSDALLRIEVARDGERRRIEARRGEGGRPAYRWFVDGRERPFDEAARRWLDGALLDLFRTAGYRAEERAGRILEQEGPDALLAEVERLGSDHARGRYLQALLRRGDLEPEQVRRALETGARAIDADHWLARVLGAAAERHRFDVATRSAFLRAAASLDADHHQARVLSTALGREDLSPENLEALLESVATGIAADHHVARILEELARRYPLEPALREPFLRAARTLDADHHRARALSSLVERDDLGAAELVLALRAARAIQGDHHLAQLLLDVASHHAVEGEVREAFLDALDTIESEHQHGRVASRIVRTNR